MSFRGAGTPRATRRRAGSGGFSDGTTAAPADDVRRKAMKLVIVVTHGSNNDKSSVAFTIANAARSAGHDVAVFLTSDGVYCAKQGYADLASFRPFKGLDELVRGFLDAKGIVWACAPCVQHRGLRSEDYLPGVIVTGAGTLIEWLAAGAQTLSF
jgi:predicted peroxiredoxin